ncbi:HNH endonuclease [Paenibacillus sp. F411]|nr:HNH endonuclease [Paenibacillus sp. F411]
MDLGNTCHHNKFGVNSAGLLSGFMMNNIHMPGNKLTRTQKRRAARKRAKARAKAAEQVLLASDAAVQSAAESSSKGGHSGEFGGNQVKRRRQSAARRDTALNVPAAVKTTVKGRPAAPPRPPRVPGQPDPYDAARLVPTRAGFIRMRGRTDKNRRWQQDIDPQLAEILVNESAAVVVNRNTIRRLYTNKGFRKYILERDAYQCYFCGNYGNTIDHLLPRAKGGHTTPVNCVCACMDCNQSKADQHLEDFIRSKPLEDGEKPSGSQFHGM